MGCTRGKRVELGQVLFSVRVDHEINDLERVGDVVPFLCGDQIQPFLSTLLFYYHKLTALYERVGLGVDDLKRITQIFKDFGQVPKRTGQIKVKALGNRDPIHFAQFSKELTREHVRELLGRIQA